MTALSSDSCRYSRSCARCFVKIDPETRKKASTADCIQRRPVGRIGRPRTSAARSDEGSYLLTSTPQALAYCEKSIAPVERHRVPPVGGDPPRSCMPRRPGPAPRSPLALTPRRPAPRRPQEYDARGLARLESYCPDGPDRFLLTPALASDCLAAVSAASQPCAAAP